MSLPLHNDETVHDSLKRRLHKALIVARNLKNQSEVEKEVNRELARRSEESRIRNRALEEVVGTSRGFLVDIENELDEVLRVASEGENDSSSLESVLARINKVSKVLSNMKDSMDSVLTVDIRKSLGNQHHAKLKHRRQSLVLNLSEADGTSLLRKSIVTQSETNMDAAVETEQYSKHHSFRNSAASRLFADDDDDSFNKPTPKENEIPLFEHFIMIGATIEAANEFAMQLKEYEEDSISNRLKKTFGGILSTSKLVGNFMSTTTAVSTPSASDPNKNSVTATNFFGFKGKERNSSVDSGGASDFLTEPILDDKPRMSDGQRSSQTTGRPSLTPPNKSMFSFFGTTKSMQSMEIEEQDKQYDQRKSNEETLHVDTDQVEFDVFVSSVAESESAENSPYSQKRVESDAAVNSHQESQKSLQMISSTTEKMVEFVSSTQSLKSAGNAFGAFFSKLNTISSPSPDKKVQDPGHLFPEQDSQDKVDAIDEETQQPGSLHFVDDQQAASLRPVEPDLLELTKSRESDIPDLPQIQPEHQHASTIICADKKAGNAVVAASVLFRYPPSVEPPPSEVSDFCLPLGGQLRTMNQKDEDSIVQEILLGHSHAKRSGKSFIFVLDDKVSEGKEVNEETGEGLGRLYGICVMVPRLVKSNVVDEARKARRAKNTQINDLDLDSSSSGDFYEFETVACYAFITRFPFFNFFFQLIYDLITLERYIRMDLSSVHADSNLEYSRYLYEYVPTDLLAESLERLSKISLPKFGEYFNYQLSPNLPQVSTIRMRPPEDVFENDQNIADWTLPPLLAWLSMDTVIWVLSLLLTENKLIIVGHEAGMITSTVLGILVLLRPLEWISPIIPLLPSKLLDFVESPVPIVAGYILNAHDKSISAASVLTKCLSDSDGIVTAILDVDSGEILLPNVFSGLIPQFCLPDADNLLQRLTVNRNQNDSPTLRTKPSYITTSTQKEEAKRIQGELSLHLTALISLGKGFRQQQQTIMSKAQVGVLEDDESEGDLEDEDDEDDSESKGKALKNYYEQIVHNTQGDTKDITTRFQPRTSETTANKVVLQDNKENFIRLGQAQFGVSDHDGFMKRFVHTQMFEEAIKDD